LGIASYLIDVFNNKSKTAIPASGHGRFYLLSLSLYYYQKTNPYYYWLTQCLKIDRSKTGLNEKLFPVYYFYAEAIYRNTPWNRIQTALPTAKNITGHWL
jgi:hypothetical protein